MMAGEVFSLSLEPGGTFLGEDRVVRLKRPFMQRAPGSVPIEIQKPIKQALDPRNILNPGKIIPEQPGSYQQAD
jgi:glycolate oxidase